MQIYTAIVHPSDSRERYTEYFFRSESACEQFIASASLISETLTVYRGEDIAPYADHTEALGTLVDNWLKEA